MHPHLLDVLVDPHTGSRLTLQSDPVILNGEVSAGGLVNDAGTRYEIREGVARMVPEQDSSVTVDAGATQR